MLVLIYFLIIQDFFQANEKYIGVYMGSYCALAYYWLYCLGYSVQHQLSVDGPSSAQASYSTINFAMAGVSGGVYDPALFYIILVFLVISGAMWTRLVWGDSDPGSIDTRFQDFDSVGSFFV